MNPATKTDLRKRLLDRRQRLQNAIAEFKETAQLTHLLKEVDSALERMNGEAYGLCEVCHEPIEDERLKADPLPADTILNVNVPDLPWSEVKGFEVTRLGNRHRAEGCIAQKDPRGNEVYWIGPAGREQDSGPGTDFHAVRTGHISITPIQVDLTRYQALEKVASWVGGLSAALDQPA